MQLLVQELSFELVNGFFCRNPVIVKYGCILTWSILVYTNLSLNTEVGEQKMKKSRYTETQIVKLLKEVESGLARGG